MKNKTPLFKMINISLKNSIQEEYIAKLIKNDEFDKKQSLPIFTFFTELPLDVILHFIKNHQIKEDVLRVYYEKYIRNREKNSELEQRFYEF